MSKAVINHPNQVEIIKTPRGEETVPVQVNRHSVAEKWEYMPEEWKPVDEWYDVSNLGSVRSWKKRKSNKIIRAEKPRNLSGSKDSYGYWQVCLHGKRVLVHQLVAKAFLKERPNDADTVDHVNRDREDNSFWNLRWATRSDQAYNRENNQRGLNNHNYKHGKYTKEERKEECGTV